MPNRFSMVKVLDGFIPCPTAPDLGIVVGWLHTDHNQIAALRSWRCWSASPASR